MASTTQQENVDPTSEYASLKASEAEKARLEEESCAKNDEKKLAKTYAKKQKDLEQILSGSYSPAETVEILRKLYVEQLAFSQAREKETLSAKRSSDAADRARELSERELSKAVQHKNKLEQLCRVLQDEKKNILAVVAKHDQEELERRKTEQASLAEKLASIEKSIQEEGEKSTAVARENDELRIQVAKLTEMNGILNKKSEIEGKLMHEKLGKHTELDQQKDALIAAALAQAEGERKQSQYLENALKETQAKFEQTTQLLLKSEETFAHYKQSLEQISKQSKKTAEDALEWKKRSVNAEHKLVEILEMLKTSEENNLKLTKQKNALEVLCRNLRESQAAAAASSAAEPTEVPEPQREAAAAN